jgi:hypothetical protein
MRHLSIATAAISVGLVLALWHAIWVALVAVGWARAVLDFILQLHFLEFSYRLAPFSALKALSLVAITFSIGALIGAAFAVVWNWLRFEETPTWPRDTKRATPAE